MAPLPKSAAGAEVDLTWSYRTASGDVAGSRAPSTWSRERQDAGHAHRVGRHEDKRVQRHGGLPANGPRADHQPRGFGLRRLPASRGGHFEVFGPGDQAHQHFSTGPVVGFVVEDLSAAVRELEAAGWSCWAGRWTSAAVGGATFGRRTATSMSSPAGSAAGMAPGSWPTAAAATATRADRGGRRELVHQERPGRTRL